MPTIFAMILACGIAASIASVPNVTKKQASAVQATPNGSVVAKGTLRGQPVYQHSHSNASSSNKTKEAASQSSKNITSMKATAVASVHKSVVADSVKVSNDTEISENGTVSFEANSSDTNISATRVKVEIFYETLCPYCQNFITNSLASAWKDAELRDHMEVYFYPYGNAQTIPKDNVSDGYRYWHAELDNEGVDYVFPCQHGPDECFGNHLQACAIDMLSTQDRYVPFIMCMEGNDTVSQEMSSFDCAKSLGISLDEVRKCVQGKQGNDLMRTIGQVTEGLKPPAGPKEYVPWITLNGVHSGQSELDGEPGGKGHFLTELCKLIDDPLPSACASVIKSAAAGLQLHRGLLMGVFAVVFAAMAI